jgi:outer membrane protein OmpA-like peptidoglycan-associated protein
MPVEVNTTDVFLFREDPLDDVEDLIGTSFILILKNFGFNSSALRPEHVNWLRGFAARYLLKRESHFAEIYAMADRKGDRKVNYKMSNARLIAVQQGLEQHNVPPKKVYHAFAKAIGEDFSEAKEVADGTKSADQRCVVLALTPAPIGVPTKFFRAPIFREMIAFCRLHQPK